MKTGVFPGDTGSWAGIPAGRIFHTVSTEKPVEQVDSLTILPTSGCNLACTYCYRRTGPMQVLSWDEIRPVLDWARTAPGGELEVTFSGGEPLLEFENLQRAFEHLGRKTRPQRPVKFRVLTNGLLFNQERLRFLVENSVFVNLSFDGMPEAQNQRGRGTWKKLDTLMGQMRNRFPEWFASHLQVTMTLTPRNLRHFADSVRYLMTRGVKTIGVSPALTAIPRWNEDLSPPLEDQLQRVFELVLKHFHDSGEVPLKAFRRYTGETVPSGPAQRSCAALEAAHPTLDTDGRLYSCLMFARSGLGADDPRRSEIAVDLDLGRVDDPGFEERRRTFAAEIRNLELFTSAPDLESRYGQCQDCPAATMCKICPLALLEFGTEIAPNKVPALLCAWKRLSADFRGRFPEQEDPNPPKVTPESIRERRRYWERHYSKEKPPGV